MHESVELIAIYQRLTVVETKLALLLWVGGAMILPLYGQVIAAAIRWIAKKNDGGGTLKTNLMILGLILLAGAGYAAPLNVDLDPTTHAMAIAGASLALTQAWKKIIAPKITSKAAPFVSIGLGIAGAFLTGFGQGWNIGQVGAGILAGGAAMVSYDLGDSIGYALKLLGIRKKG